MILGEMTARARAHVLWLGGAPRCGKTTLARLLAGKYDLKIYNLDWHQVREHRERLDPARHPVACRWDSVSMEDRWVRPGPDELFERAIAVWTEMFELVVQDLRALPESRPILAEGPGAFPWCVAPLLASTRAAIWLVPTPELRDAVALRRYGSAMGDFPGVSDPERAARNLRERDLRLSQRIGEKCVELGLTCVEMDGSHDVDASLALVEEHFRPHLPATLNV
jgi:hypothetical protein